MVYVDPKDYSAAIKKVDITEEKVEFVAAEVQQSEGLHLGREVGILYGFMFGALIYVAYSLLVVLKVV
jgi:tetrahydromethanopterin S-methyltransferase subunit G